MKRIVSIKILIIDDSTVARKSIKENLRNFNIEFVEAADGENGFAQAITSLPDLILLDLNLPDTHGFEVLKKLRGHPTTAHIPVIITTVSRVAKDVEEAHISGAQSYILKPVEPGMLLSKILKILNINESEIASRTIDSAQAGAEASKKASAQTSSFQKIEAADLKPEMELGLPILSPAGNILFKAGTVLDGNKIQIILKENIKIAFIKPR